MKFSVFRDRKKKKLSFTFSSPFSLRVSWWNIVANALLLESNDKSGKRNPILMGFIFPTTIAMVFVLLFLPPTLHHIPRFFISVTAFYVHMLTTPHREQHHECKNDIHQKNGTEKNHHETFWSFGFFYSIMINGRTWKQKKREHKVSFFFAVDARTVEWLQNFLLLLLVRFFSGGKKSPARDRAAWKSASVRVSFTL